jgi:AAA15 family ATPase/GTPase
MFRSIKIENFRGFKHFELQQLGRINLLVGLNNSGKTSILEAVQLLCSRTNFEPLTEIMLNRGEYFRSDDKLSDNRRDTYLDICHLFFGHEIKPKVKFSISSMSDQLNEEEIVGSIDRRPIRAKSDLNEDSSEQINILESIDSLYFNVKWNNFSARVLLSVDGGIPLSSSMRSMPVLISHPYLENLRVEDFKTQFISSFSLDIDKAAELFDQIVLTPNENLVEEALQIIEPEIEKIALVRSERKRLSTNIRGGFIIRLRNSDQRIPIGSMGDGVWRILALALAIVCAKGGVLLVDEIDTGLHFSAMSKMWKLIWETAKKLDVQVFATTHNSDCWTSLAMIAEEAENTEDEISIQRIERDKQKAVAFTRQEIVIAAERGIEVR